MNEKIGNKPFLEKKNELIDAGYSLPQFINGLEKWDSPDVNTHVGLMAEEAYHYIWKNITKSCTLTHTATLVFVSVASLHFIQKRSPQYVQVSLTLGNISKIGIYMASKMPAAIDGSKRKINISMAESSDYEPPLKCEFCDAKVSFVNGFTREVGDNIISVNPYFRLKTGNTHESECKYNVEGQVKVIARESEGNILTQTESGKFELRLLAVKKAIKELQDLAKKKTKDESDNQKETKEKEYIKSGKKLGSYINSALRVLKVRSFCEENADIENILELVFDGVRLPWKDFYYEDKDFFRCYSNIRKATVTVPIAVIGVVKSIRVIGGKTGEFTVINLASPYRKTDKKDTLDSVNVSIWSPDIELFKGYKVDDVLLAFGIFDAREVSEKSNNSSTSLVKNSVITI